MVIVIICIIIIGVAIGVLMSDPFILILFVAVKLVLIEACVSVGGFSFGWHEWQQTFEEAEKYATTKYDARKKYNYYLHGKNRVCRYVALISNSYKKQDAQLKHHQRENGKRHRALVNILVDFGRRVSKINIISIN